jgi:hypothetical protein
MCRCLILVVAAFVAAIAPSRAKDQPQTLTVMRECPAVGWHRACLPIAFLFTEDGSGRLRTVQVDEGSFYPRTILDHILVKGSLIEGGGPGVFRLKLDYPVSESEADSPNELGALAFVGRSLNGRPIVLTDRGPLEIRTPGIDFELPAEIYVVRRKSKRVISKLVGGSGMPFVATKAGEIGVWDSKRAICIAAPTARTRNLQIITTACKAAGVPEDGAIIGGNAIEDPDVNELEALEIVGQEPAGVGVFKAPGTDLLLIWVNWQYCC